MVTDTRANRYIDLDSAIDESEPITVKLKGKEFQIPGQPDAKVILKYIRYFNDRMELDNDQVAPFFRDLVGPDTYDEMLDLGMGFPQLTVLIEYLLEAYGIVKPLESGSPNPQG